MSVTAGALSAVKINANNAQLLSAVATAGTGPYTYQWYKSFTTGFTANAGTLIPGATSLAFTDTQLLPATQYYYKVIATDLGAGSATSTSAQLSVLTVAGNPVEMNQLVQTPIIGMADQPTNPNTKSAVIDSSFGTALAYPGQPVKQVTPQGVTTGQGLNTLPHVVPCTAVTDKVFGFIQYNPKDASYTGGSPCEISQTNNVIWALANANGTAGDSMQLDTVVNPLGLITAVGSSGATIVGNALDTPVVGMPFRLDISVLPKVSA